MSKHQMTKEPRIQRPFLEAMETRRLLSAAPVPNVLGLYTGDLNFSDGNSDTLTITITSEHKRNFAGSFAEGSGPVAKLQGTINARGILDFTYRGGFRGRGTGSFDSTGTIFSATFITHESGDILTGTIDVQLQGTRPAIPTIPQLGSQYDGTIEFSDGNSDTMDLTLTSQHQKNLVGYFTQGDGASAVFAGTVDVNRIVRFRYHGGGPAQGVPRFHGVGSGAVSNGSAEIDATFTSQEAGETLTGSFKLIAPPAPVSAQVVSVIDGPIQSPVNGHFYSVLSNSDWTTAENAAQSMGGHLATIRSSAEEAWIQQTFAAYPYLWIGLYDPSQDSNGMAHAANFIWVDGEPLTYTNWDPAGEPNNYGGDEYWTQLVLTHSSTVAPDTWDDIFNAADPIHPPNSYGPDYGLVEVG